jgi:hypothetical protein
MSQIAAANRSTARAVAASPSQAYRAFEQTFDSYVLNGVMVNIDAFDSWGQPLLVTFPLTDPEVVHLLNLFQGLSAAEQAYVLTEAPTESADAALNYFRECYALGRPMTNSEGIAFYNRTH